MSHIRYTCFHTFCNSLLHLDNILCIPAITKNLISISKLLADNNIITEFVANLYFIKDKKKAVHLAQGIARGGLYLLLSKNDFLSNSCYRIYEPSSMLSIFNNSARTHDSTTEHNTCNKFIDNQCHVISQLIVSGNLLHKRLGHPNKHAIRRILPHLSLNSSITLTNFCDACQYGKMH